MTPGDLPALFVVDGSVAVTGGFVCARNEARLLRGQARVVLVLPHGSRIPAEQLADFAAVYRLGLGQPRKSLRALLTYVPTVLLSSWRLSRLLRAAAARHLQVNDFFLLQGALCRLFGYRGKLVTWIRFDPLRFPLWLSRFWLRAAAMCSDELVAVSAYIQSRLPQGLRSTVLYDCVQLRSGKIEGAIGASTRRLVYIANYIPGKGQDDALQAFGLVAAEFPDVVLEFWGGDMGLDANRRFRASLEAQASHMGIAQQVHFNGLAADALAVFAGAFAALNFSRSESFSMTVLEAASVGVPVVATNSGGPAEIIHHGVTGLLVPVRNISAMARAVRQLLVDPQAAARMGEAARRHAEDEFSCAQFRSGLRAVLGL